MNTLVKNLLKDHIIRPAARALANTEIVKESITEVLAEPEFSGLVETLRDQAVAGATEALLS